ncbi:nuclease SbcCD subunit C-like [Diprion similis]|uniref:nuclease SbcCD subunit C-like n=1 Tax=Diprion similis TaxID=362088 RepID=UPI001EF8F2AA|nr:nuclease SbcCD subunit C-like [Diprion similis]
MKMWVSVVGVMVLCLYVNPTIAKEVCSDSVIKDALLNLAHAMRLNSQKLERHELRDRQAAEHLNKAMGVLVKKSSVLDTVTTNFTQIEDRISGIEQLISQKDERERIQLQKTVDLIERLEAFLETQFKDMKTKMSEMSERTEVTTPPTTPESTLISDIISKINDTEENLIGHVARIDLGVSRMANRSEDNIAVQNEKLQTIINEVQNISSRITDIETALKKDDEISEKDKNESMEQIVNIELILKQQNETLGTVTEHLEGIANRIQLLPTAPEVEARHLEIKEAVEGTQHTLSGSINNEVDGLRNQVCESEEKIKNSIGDLRLSLAMNSEYVNKELAILTQGQAVLESAAENIEHTKKKVVFGVHQTISGIEGFINDQNAIVNDNFNEKIITVSNNIIGNQSKALANLTMKMEDEILKVGRKVDEMYLEMTKNAGILEKLHQKNEVYVNDTTLTIDGIETQVADITKHIYEVHKNLNVLMGRISTVSYEFGNVKIALGTALDKIKDSFKEVQEKAKDITNPGPHPVPEVHEEPEVNPSTPKAIIKPNITIPISDVKPN